MMPPLCCGRATARVHQLFRPEHVDEVRKTYPEMKVIVTRVLWKWSRRPT